MELPDAFGFIIVVPSSKLYPSENRHRWREYLHTGSSAAAGQTLKAIAFLSAGSRVKMPQIEAKRVRVLAVDDSPAFLHTLCCFLEDDPIFEIVATAQSGQEALGAAKSSCPHVVVMDLQMPGMNGLEATVQLHQHYPELPVIILTAHDLPTLREACRKHGAYAFLTKGQLSQHLPALLAKALLPPGISH
jgi:CheY-like chemotaxis protein